MTNLNDQNLTWLTHFSSGSTSTALVKPTQSYIGLIAQAILSTPDKRLLLSELYEWILKTYPYFRFKGNGWRNSVRHNLSLNDCFIKAGRAPNGKSSYWTIHPANLEDFSKGDFRRKQAQWKVKSHDVRAYAGQLTSLPYWPMEIHPFLASYHFKKPEWQIKQKQKFDIDSLLKN